MEISIITISGRTFPLTVQPQTTVASLKKLIQQKENVPVNRQKLTLELEDGQRTHLAEDSRTLGSYNVQSGSKVALLVLAEPVTIQVFVRKDGTSERYDVKPDEMVSKFRLRVHHRQSVPIDQFRLSYQSRDLMDGDKLSDYDIKDGSIIEMLFRLRGG